MSDIRKRSGSKGTTYQVRHPSKATKSGYAYKTFNTLKEARAFREDASARKYNSSTNCEISTVNKAIDFWLNICERVGRDGKECVEPETIRQYKWIAKHILDYQWEKYIQEIESVDIVHFRSWLLENKTRDIAKKSLSAFHSVLIEMKQHGYIKDDPASGISIKSSGRIEEYNKEKDIPSDKEIRNILCIIDDLSRQNNYTGITWGKYRPMFYLAVFTGMRPSEYRGLSWNNVYKDRVELRQRADQSGRIGALKSKAGNRTIYLPKVLSDMLFEWKKTCPESNLNLVFPTESGNPQLLSSIRRGAWIPLMKKAGLMKLQCGNGNAQEKIKYTMYSLRHYFASKLIEKGTDFKIIQETMGHSKIELTFNVYGHLLKDREEERKEIAEQLMSEIVIDSNEKDPIFINN